MESSYSTRLPIYQASLWHGKQPLLLQLQMELTERCNLSCIHCYINQAAGDPQIQARELTTAQVKAILKEAAELGALTVHFTGGEPLLRPDFSELYVFARRLGLKVILFTNGTLLTPELADLFARVPPLEKIEITIYGMSAESYEAVTGVRGACKAARRAVELLQERQVPFLVKSAFLPPNRDELPAFEAWAATLPGMDSRAGLSMFYNLRARRDSADKNRRIQSLRLLPEVGVRLLTRQPERHHREMEQFCGKFMRPPGDRLFRCGAGKTICVDAYGKVQPCMLLRHPDVVYDLVGGNEPTPLKNALVEFFPRLRKIRAENPEYLARCARCFLMGLCEQCPAKSWMEHGTLDTPVEYECSVAHAHARELGLLAADERAWAVIDWKERIECLGVRTSGNNAIDAERG